MKRLSILLVFVMMLCGCSLNIPGTVSTVQSQTGTTATAANVQYYFPRAGQHPDQALVNVINSAESTLDIAIYSLTKKEIVNAIAADENRGVKVRLITDKSEAGNKYQAQELKILKAAGVPIKEDTHSGLMHLKMTIADAKICTTGSYNYTQGATNENDEVLVVFSDPKIAQDFDAQFNRMWQDKANFKDW